MMIQELINLKSVAHINVPKHLPLNMLPHDASPGKKAHLHRSFNILLTEN